MESDDVTIKEVAAAVQQKDSDWQARTYDIESHREMADKLRANACDLFPDDQDWATSWVAAYQVSNLLENCEPDQLKELYNEAQDEKPWILAAPIAFALRFGCDRAFTQYAVLKLAKAPQDLPQTPTFPSDFVIQEFPEANTFEQLFGNVAKLVLNAFGIEPTDQLVNLIVGIYDRIFRNPGKHWEPPYEYAKKLGLSDADILKALQTKEAFERFDPFWLEIIFDRNRPKRLSLRDHSPKRK